MRRFLQANIKCFAQIFKKHWHLYVYMYYIYTYIHIHTCKNMHCAIKSVPFIPLLLRFSRPPLLIRNEISALLVDVARFVVVIVIITSWHTYIRIHIHTHILIHMSICMRIIALWSCNKFFYEINLFFIFIVYTFRRADCARACVFGTLLRSCVCVRACVRSQICRLFTKNGSFCARNARK